jgi:hypothetical protein
MTVVGGPAECGASANSLAQPACLLACPLQAVSTYLSSFCYAEFAVSMPLAGAAYNYIVSALGEFIAWVSHRGWSVFCWVMLQPCEDRPGPEGSPLWHPCGGRTCGVTAPLGRVHMVSASPVFAL